MITQDLNNLDHFMVVWLYHNTLKKAQTSGHYWPASEKLIGSGHYQPVSEMPLMLAGLL